MRLDLHIHTLLSPCGSLEMSPARIIEEAKRKKLDIIGIADHNTTRQCREVKRLGEKSGITVFCGAEVTTKEEAHCLTFFEDSTSLDLFQKFLDKHLPDIKNVPEKFGDQVWVDEDEMIAGEEERLLISALDVDVEEIERKVHELNGIFIPAHIDRPMYSIISQLGFLPPALHVDALEIAGFSKKEMMIRTYGLPDDILFITSSDAHHPHQIGTKYTELDMKEATFAEFRRFLMNSTQQ
jgi:PHP family Zn ribbon phosphoesterase